MAVLGNFYFLKERIMQKIGKPLPKPRVYEETIAEVIVGVRKDLLAQIDTLEVAVQNESYDLDTLLFEAQTLLNHMGIYINNRRLAKNQLDSVLLSSPLRMYLSLSDKPANKETM